MKRRSMMFAVLLPIVGAPSVGRALDLLAPTTGRATLVRCYVWVRWDPESQTQFLVFEPIVRAAGDKAGVLLVTPSQPEWFDVGPDFFVGLTAITQLAPEPKLQRRAYRKLSDDAEYPREADLDAIKHMPAAALGNRQIIRANDSQEVRQWFHDRELGFTALDKLVIPDGEDERYVALADADVQQLPMESAGVYTGALGPVGVRFKTSTPILPATLTPSGIIVEFRIFIHAPHKMDLPDPHSYMPAWVSLLRRVEKSYRLKEYPLPNDFKDALESFRLDPRTEKFVVAPTGGSLLHFGKWLSDSDVTGYGEGRVPGEPAEAPPAEAVKAASPQLNPSWYLTKISTRFTPEQQKTTLELRPTDEPWIRDRSEHTFVLPHEVHAIRAAP